MLQEVIDLQNDAVTGIVSLLNKKDEITFKAPTGSGKTYMMADLMDRVLNKDKDVIFIVSSLSKGDLAAQNFEKFEEYVENKTFNHINPYMINSETGEESALFIPTDYNVYVLPRDLYKDKSKLKSGGAFINFLNIITKPSPLGMDKKIYLIKDECHIATSNLDSLKDLYFSKTLNFSATPKFKKKTDRPDILIKEEDAVKAHLIKTVIYGNENDSLEDAVLKFKEIKEAYSEVAETNSFGSVINPCLIIQISNKENGDKEVKEIQSVLSKYTDLQWMLIVDKDKDCDTNTVLKKAPVSKWKWEVKKPESTIDIIIFKMVITEGWDIPRACMLYQMRDSKSEQLDEQVIGRVRRNPKLLEFENLTKDAKELMTTAYVWGIVDKEKIDTKDVRLVDKKVQEEFKIKTTRLKKPIESKSFDIHKLLSGKKPPLVPESIFDLYFKYINAPQEVIELGNTYIKDIQSWFKFVNNIDEIIKTSKDIVCDYSKNMELVKNEYGKEIETSLPFSSYYTEETSDKNEKNKNNLRIKDWVWKRTDEKEEFSFDSDAEKEWLEILKELTTIDAPSGRLVKHIEVKDLEETKRYYLFGKNYLPNSEIKFEYYLYGIHCSYPDFILKDHKDRIHLFESKSLNKSSSFDFDGEEYEEKIGALMECYKQASKLTKYFFYIPIKKEDNWIIYQYEDGNEHPLSLSEFLDFMKK